MKHEWLLVIYSIKFLFGNYSERSSFLNFVQTYYTMLGVVSNFDVAMRQEVTTWDITNNLKYKVIGWHDLLKEKQLNLLIRLMSGQDHH